MPGAMGSFQIEGGRAACYSCQGPWVASKSKVEEQLAILDRNVRAVQLSGEEAGCRHRRPYLGRLAARISSLWMSGALANRSPALTFSLKAAATLPLRCASRPASSSNVSKMAKEDGPS